MKTAHLIWKKDTDPARAASRCLWKVDHDTFLVTSSVRIDAAGIRETLTFPADADGNILDFGELGVADYADHEGALRAAGYVPATGEAS